MNGSDAKRAFEKVQNFGLSEIKEENKNLKPDGRASLRTYCSSGVGLLSERGTAMALTIQAAQRQEIYSIPGVAMNANLSPDLTPTEY